MKVGLVIYGSLATVSGGYLYDRKLVETLAGRGDEVEIISQPWGRYLTRLGYNLQPGWKRRFQALDIDVMLQDELNHPSLPWVNREMKNKIRYPILAITHHLRSSENHPHFSLWLYRQVEKSYLQGVDGFIWNSRTTRQVVESVIPKKMPGIVAYPAGNRLGGMEEAEIRQRTQEPGPLRMLFAGSLIARKGLHNLIAALASLPSKGWELRVAGSMKVDPTYCRRVVRQVAAAGLGERIQFLGILGEEDLAREFRAAQLLVMVSQYEGFGIVYLEGMSFGLPAIASTAGAAGEIIRDGMEGRLVKAGDVAALAGAIRQYMGDRELLRSHSLAAHRRFGKFPTWEQSGMAIRQFLVDTLEDWNRRFP